MLTPQGHASQIAGMHTLAANEVNRFIVRTKVGNVDGHVRGFAEAVDKDGHFGCVDRHHENVFMERLVVSNDRCQDGASTPIWENNRPSMGVCSCPTASRFVESTTTPVTGRVADRVGVRAGMMGGRRERMASSRMVSGIVIPSPCFPDHCNKRGTLLSDVGSFLPGERRACSWLANHRLASAALSDE